jgi:hypothetical protein
MFQTPPNPVFTIDQPEQFFGARCRKAAKIAPLLSARDGLAATELGLHHASASS